MESIHHSEDSEKNI